MYWSMKTEKIVRSPKCNKKARDIDKWFSGKINYFVSEIYKMVVSDLFPLTL